MGRRTFDDLVELVYHQEEQQAFRDLVAAAGEPVCERRDKRDVHGHVEFVPRLPPGASAPWLCAIVGVVPNILYLGVDW